MTEFVVIGAGLPRTGTMSTMTALEQILGGPCYHMKSVLDQKDRAVFWRGLQTGEVPTTSESFRNHFSKDGFVAGVDFPPANYYKELMDAYPNAKVLLTVREPERWYLSVKNTIYNFVYVFPRTWPYSWYNTLTNGKALTDMVNGINPKLLESVRDGEEAAVQFYNEWVEEVKKSVPPERLLVFSVKEGWEPLCAFLGLPVPGTPFPNVNDTAVMLARIRNFKRMSWGLVTVLSAGLVGVVAAAVHYTDIGRQLTEKLM